MSFDRRPDLALLAFATAAEACTAAPTADAAAVQARLAAIFAADPRLAATRTDENMFAGWRVKLFAWLQNMLESAGMQRYAGGARFVYLALVLVGASALALRLVRRRRLHQRERAAAAQPTISLSNAVDAAGWERHAATAIQAEDLRRAVACIDAALRSRLASPVSNLVGSTTRELVGAASPMLRERMLPVLTAVEGVCFAGGRDKAAVAAVLARVAALPRGVPERRAGAQ